MFKSSLINNVIEVRRGNERLIAMEMAIEGEVVTVLSNVHICPEMW